MESIPNLAVGEPSKAVIWERFIGEDGYGI
jgi:hypothetical protein